MDPDPGPARADPGPAQAVAGAVCAAAVGMREAKLWNLLDRDLLSLAQTYEKAARLVYAAQVHLAGEINTRNLAGSHGYTCTAARPTAANGHAADTR